MKPYKVGLALSGGGIRGIAHVGVLQALLENDIVPECVVGTSAGSIVGALYAAGKTPDEMMEFVQAFGLLNSVRLGWAFDGLSSLSFLKEHLNKSIGHDSFEQLKHPLYIGITNLNDGELEMANSGSLSDTVMASCAIPLVFRPVEINNKIYVDGGVMNNLSIKPIREQCETLIGVNLMPKGQVQSKSLHNVIGIATRLFYLSIVASSSRSLTACDIALDLKGLGSYPIFKILTKDFTGLYQIGYETTIQQMPQILERVGRLSAPV